jgi:hypothetical protein
LSGVQLRQLSSRGFNDRRKSLALASLEQGSRISATEALGSLDNLITLNVKRQDRGWGYIYVHRQGTPLIPRILAE